MSVEDDAFGQMFRNEVEAAFQRGFKEGKLAVLMEVARLVQNVVA